MKVRCPGALPALFAALLLASFAAASPAASPAATKAATGLSPAAPASAARPAYRVTADSDLRWLQVHACFAHDVVLRPVDAVGRRYLQSVRLIPQAQPEQQRAPDARIAVPAGCVEYRFDLLAAERAQAGSRVRRVGRDLLVSPNLWMWLPTADGVEVRLEPPPGMSISVPWPELAPADETGAGRYLMQPGPAGWHPVAAFGGFRIQRVPIGDQVLRLAMLDGDRSADRALHRTPDPEPDHEVLIEWLGVAARSLLTVTPAFPVPSPQVLVVPVTASERRDARTVRATVPWARVLRDGGSGVQFFIDQRGDLAAIESDWTAAHEFAHLLLPFVSLGDAWISEGFASYYQNVLRARSGGLGATQAWQRLYEGFERGRRDEYEDTLRESIRDGGSNRTMRMYWSGAAVALLADLELRRRSEGRSSLDTVLADFAACCLPSRRSWRGRELFDRLDVLSGADIFGELYERHADSTRFPDLDAAFARLGLRVEGGRVELVAAPDAALRDAIMAPFGASSGP